MVRLIVLVYTATVELTYRQSLCVSVGFRDWLARKMMQELVKVKQNQANIVKHLLGSITSRGLAYFTELERLNSEDTARNMERMRHTHVRNDYRLGGHLSGYPTTQGPQVDSVYAKVTNVNNNANIPADNARTPAKVPVYRIRSLPQIGEDDTIMIATPTAESSQPSTRSPRSPKSHSRQHAPLPPVPNEDIDSVYSLAQAVHPAQPPPSIQHSSSSRQNAPLPPPPSIAQVSPTHIKIERIIMNNDSVSELEYDDEAEEVYDDASSRIAPSEKWQQTTPHPPSPLVRKSGITQAPQPPETRKNSSLPPLPPPSLMDSPDTNKQPTFIKHVDSGTAACTNRADPKQQMLTGAPTQPSKQSLEANKLSVAPRPRRSRSRSPSPPSPAVPCRSPGTKQKSTPSPPPPQVLEKVHISTSSNLPEPTIHRSSHRPLISTRGEKCYSTSQIPSLAIRNSENAPPKPPFRKVSAPVESSHPPVGKESVSDAPGMPPVPPRKTSGGKPNLDPEAPPLPSRKIIDNSESSVAPHLHVHKTPDTSELIAPPLPLREVIKDQGGSPGKKPTRRNATRTQSSELLTSLPEKQENESHSLFTSLGEGIFSRCAMQKRLHGLLRAPTRNRATSNQFSSRATPKIRLGKRLSDPSNQTEDDKNCVPIHKTPLPPIPVQMHTSASAPQMVLEDVPQDVYEDLDKACELVNQDVPQFDYEDLDMQTDKPQDHYEDIDMDADKPQDHYEDIDYETEDRPQEVYEDINNEAAQRVNFVINGTHVPQDYTPPIVRRSVAYPEEDEPQDYTPPIRRGGAHVELDEPQDYTTPIRRSRVYADDEEEEEEPQEYTPPVVKKSVIVDNQSMPAPPLPPRSASREQQDRRRGRHAPVTITPPMSPASTKTQPDQQHQASRGQLTARVSQPPPVSPPTKGRARSRSPVPPPVSRSRPEAPPPSPSKAPPQPTNVGVPAPSPAPPMGGGAPPPPPPPATGHQTPLPVSSPVHSRETSAYISQETDNEPPSELLSGIRNVQLKKASERKPPPQKPPPPVSSGSSTASLFAEMQSFQLKKTKRPTDTKPSQVDGCDSSAQSAPTIPFHAALRPTKSVGQTPPKPAPRTKSPAAVRPKPNKVPPPAIKPKPAHLLPSKQSDSTAHTSPTSPVHSNSHVMLKSRDRLGVPATS